MNNSKRLKSLSVGNLYAKRFAVMALPEDGDFAQVFNAEIPKGGIWLIHGEACFNNYLAIPAKAQLIRMLQQREEQRTAEPTLFD